jgi:Spy/CpxP family protein refolding chaperone
MKKLVLFLAVVLLVGMSVSAYAMNKKGMAGKGMHGEQMMKEKFEALGLDEKQKETVMAIHLKTKKEMVRKKADVEVAQIELKELLGKDPVDLQAAEAKVKQIEALKTDMKMTHIRTREEVKKVLTPEQKKKFAALHHGCMECGEGAGGMGCGMHEMKGMKGNCKDCKMMKDGDDDKKPGKHEHPKK